MENGEIDNTALHIINNYVNPGIREDIKELLTAMINMGNPTIDNDLLNSIEIYDLDSNEIGSYVVEYLKDASKKLLNETGVMIKSEAPINLHTSIYITIYAMVNESIASNAILEDDTKNDLEKFCSLVSVYTPIAYDIAYEYINDITPTIFENIIEKNKQLESTTDAIDNELIEHIISILTMLIRINPNTPKTFIGRNLSQYQYDATFNDYIPYINSIIELVKIDPELFASEIYNILYVSEDMNNDIANNYQDYIEENYLAELTDDEKQNLRNIINNYETTRRGLEND